MTIEKPETLPHFRRRDADAEARRFERAKRREVMLDALASGLTHADIADAFKISPRTLRREIAKCLEQRRGDTAENRARIQLERLNKGLRAISAALDAGDLKATKPLLQVIERIDYYNNIVARLDHATATTTASPPLAAPPPALALGVKPAETEPARTDLVLLKY